MKIVEVSTPSITANRLIEFSDGPVVGERRPFRVDRMSVTYAWSPAVRGWKVLHIDLRGPVQKKDGTDGVAQGSTTLWSYTQSQRYDEFRRIAKNLAPVGDPALPGVLDA